MNIHIGSWIVPLLVMLVAIIRAFWVIGSKVQDKLTWQDARKANWKTPDEAVQAAVAFVMLSKALAISLGGWLAWAIIISWLPLTCGI